jgi:DTW domain-containing protein YfiP
MPNGSELTFKRQLRKKALCAGCGSSQVLCLCDVVPQIDLRTRVCLIIHHREMSRSSNTGLLALKALRNGEVRIRGEGREALDLSDLLVDTGYRTLLLFPANGALELGDMVGQDPRPIQLIVPDGTWRQARKLVSRHPELMVVPRVKIRAPDRSVFQLRAQSQPDRMATLHALACALGVIEGEQIATQLMTLYHTKIQRTLAGRGILSSGHSEN